MKKELDSDKMLPEYDFSKGVRGKYAKQYHQKVNVAVLAPDVAKYFPNSESVNQALRSVVAVTGKKHR